MSEKTGRKRTRLLTATILFGSIVSLLEAAIPTGTVVGTVRDESGAIIPGAKVTITHQGTGAVRSMQTDSSGNYNFPLLPVGTYTLKIEMQGFQTFVQKEFLLQVDQNLTIPVTMKLGEITQELTVEGATAGVDLVKATVIEVVDQRRIVDLPLNGRNPLQLQFLMPGVVFDNVSQGHGQGQNEGAVINGNRPGSNYFLMDGVDAVDSYLGVAPRFPSPDALQEFSVQTSQFSAEFGRNAGGLVNAVIKSGTNEFHGTLFELLRWAAALETATPIVRGTWSRIGGRISRRVSGWSGTPSKKARLQFEPGMASSGTSSNRSAITVSRRPSLSISPETSSHPEIPATTMLRACLET